MKQEINNEPNTNQNGQQPLEELNKIETPTFELPSEDEHNNMSTLPAAVSGKVLIPENTGKAIQKPVDNAVGKAESDFFGIDAVNNYADGQISRKFTWLQKAFTEKSLVEAVKMVQKERVTTSHKYQLKLYETGMQYKLSAITELLTAKLQMVKVETRGQVASFASHKLQGVAQDISVGLRGYLQQHKNDYDYCETLKGYPTYEQYWTYLMSQEVKLFGYFDAMLENFVQSIIEKVKRFDA